jgi:threonine dehydratase
MPRFTPGVKVERTRGFGAEVVLHGDTLDEARSHALGAGRERAADLRPPLRRRGHHRRPGHGRRWRCWRRAAARHAGGGRGRRRPDRRHGGRGQGAEAGIRSSACRRCAFPTCTTRSSTRRLPQGGSTIAEGIAVGTPGKVTQRWWSARRRHGAGRRGRHRAGHRDAAGDREDAGRRRGRAPLAALMKEPARFAGRKVGLVLGGGNIDPMLLAAIIQRGMVRAGRLARVRVCARDVPGSLARITATVGEAGANIDEVHHQRAFTMLAAQNVEIELVMQTRGRRTSRRCCRRCAPPASKRRSSDGQSTRTLRGAAEYFAPWVQALGLRAEAFDATASRCGCRRATSCRAWRHAVRPGHDGRGRHRDGAGADQPVRRFPALHDGADEHQLPEAAVGPGRAGAGHGCCAPARALAFGEIDIRGARTARARAGRAPPTRSDGRPRPAC